LRAIALLFLTTVLYAADVSGRWIGKTEFVNRDGEVRSGSVFLTLRQSGEDVNGTAGPSAEWQQEIRNGKVRSGKLTFEVEDPSGKAVVELSIGDEVLSGEAKLHREYGVIAMKLELKREAADKPKL
jgi:hypothetical protein